MIVIDGVEMVDVHEAARLVGRSAETVRRWVWSGKVGAVKQGNKYFVPRAELPEAGPDGSPAAETLSLRSWAELAAHRRHRGHPEGTGRDLVLDDRAERADR